MSVQAYQKTLRSTESPRDTEYRLFAQVTQALIDAEKAGRADMPRLIDALDWNRRLWSALAGDCASEGNQLPQAVRAQIISISLWVSRYTSEVSQGKSGIEALIEVNRSIMAGLVQRPA
jgi:flagellar protein FlaF